MKSVGGLNLTKLIFGLMPRAGRGGVGRRHTHLLSYQVHPFYVPTQIACVRT
jgi:hypothetical protein